MHRLSPAHYESVRHLFRPSYPNLSIIHGVIEGNIRGEIWGDHPTLPQTAFVLGGGIYGYIGGKMGPDHFEALFATVLKPMPLLKICCDDNFFNLTSFGFKPVQRRQYRFSELNPSLPSWDTPPDLEIKQIESMALFAKTQWFNFISQFYLDSEDFLLKGLGFVLWDDAKHCVASEAFALITHEWAEIATITHEDYRRQQLSTLLCNHLIHALLKQKLRPIWSCEEDNIASWKIAERQGMDERIDYIFQVRDIR